MEKLNKKVIPAMLFAFVLTMAMSSVPVTAKGKNELCRVVFIKYANPAEQTTANVVDVGDPDEDGAQDGYELIVVYGNVLHWNLTDYPDGVPYVINPSGARGLDQEAVVDEIKASLESWDAWVDVELYNNDPTIDTGATASTWRPDYKNVITWARLRRGIVAVASIWYYKDTGEIVDADITLNSRYKWGIDPDGEDEGYVLTGAFDIQNVVTHEAGHWSGLNDLKDSTYSEMTMYGYTTYGETKKISLEPGDIAGVQAVYGNGPWPWD